MDQAKEIVARVFDIPLRDVTDDLSRETFEKWTSLNHLLLVSELETELGIEFTTEEVLRIRNFGDIEQIVLSKSRR